MSLYLDTSGNASLAIGICDRCSRKFPIVELFPDPNALGMRVCRADVDQYDPWRLPARIPENISLMFARPDVLLTREARLILLEDGEWILIGDGEYLELGDVTGEGGGGVTPIDLTPYVYLEDGVIIMAQEDAEPLRWELE